MAVVAHIITDRKACSTPTEVILGTACMVETHSKAMLHLTIVEAWTKTNRITVSAGEVKAVGLTSKRSITTSWGEGEAQLGR